MFSIHVGELVAADVAVAQALADVATIGLLQERGSREKNLVAAPLQRALSSRVLIEQAKGVVAFTNTVDMEEAFAILRRHARNNGLPLVEVAENVVNRSLAL